MASALRRSSVLLVLSLLSLGACGHGRVSWTGDVTYARTAEENYQEGVNQLAAGHSEDAVKFFEHVRAKFPFSPMVALAELRLADVRQKQGHYGEAVDVYQQFLKAHPKHEQADFAAYQIGACQWAEAPSRIFILPPDYERDLSDVRTAVTSFEEFLKKYPESKYRAEAQRQLDEAREALINHEWYVAGFYAKRGHWAGVAARMEGIVKNYPGSRREAEALYGMAEACLKLDERFRAQQALQQLIVTHPDAPQRGAAEKLLASIR